MTHPTHQTRISDSSLYDEICKLCGVTDAHGMSDLERPCRIGSIRPATEAELLQQRASWVRGELAMRETYSLMRPKPKKQEAPVQLELPLTWSKRPSVQMTQHNCGVLGELEDRYHPLPEKKR